MTTWQTVRPVFKSVDNTAVVDKTTVDYAVIDDPGGLVEPLTWVRVSTVNPTG